MVRGELMEDEQRQVLFREGEQPIVVMLARAHILPKRRQGVAGVCRHLLADLDFFLLEDAPLPEHVDGLVTDRIACPLHGRGEELSRDMRQQVPRHRQQHVRSEVWVLPRLIVLQMLRLGDAEPPAADFFIRELPCDWDEADGSLHRRLDPHQHLLNLGREMPPPRVYEVSQLSGGAVEGHQHCADTLVSLALLAPHVNDLLVVAVPAEVALEEACHFVLEFRLEHLHPFLADRLEFLVEDYLHVELRLEATPIVLDFLCAQSHAADEITRHHAAAMCLDVRRARISLDHLLPEGDTAAHGLDLGCVLVHLSDRLPAVMEAAEVPLNAQRGVVQHKRSAPADEAAETSLKTGTSLHLQTELPPREEAFPNRLDLGHAVFQLLLVLARLELPVPALQDGCVLAVVAMHLLTIPHFLALLDGQRRLALLLDLPLSDPPTNGLLNQGKRSLLVRLSQDVGGVVRDDIMTEVVIIALSIRSETRRHRTLQVPMPLVRRLRESRLEGVRVEEQPSVAAGRTHLV
mmetsp:Transcript_70415/g.195978  ORF Transcript_70415/g.195978 Transcript_70415/m.195978 type:complete len:519 (-) Transcript_70415:1315-2871(-)